MVLGGILFRLFLFYIAFTTPLVIGPKKPTAGVILLAFWNFISAARVRAPNRVISLPGEPAPVFATINPLAFRNFCNSFTSARIIPMLKLRLKINFVVDADPEPVPAPEPAGGVVGINTSPGAQEADKLITVEMDAEALPLLSLNFT